MYKNIKQKVHQQRVHLVSTRNFLIKQIELKREITVFVQNSKEKLNHAQQTNSASANINILGEKLADDQRLYAECKILIQELRTEIKATKTQIKKSKLKLRHLFFPQKTSGFFKQKDDNSQVSNFSDQAARITLQDKFFKGA